MPEATAPEVPIRKWMVFQVDFEIAKASATIKTMVEDLGLEEEDEENVPLPNVNTGILKSFNGPPITRTTHP
ncbi:hypothetical protein QTP88_005219 [Uroleucon formosanum]